jgi:Undecaprenyl-phosphate glucose phosphotransferase
VLKEQHRFFLSVLIAADTAMIAATSVAAYYLRFHWFNELYPPEEAAYRYATHGIPVFVALACVLGAMLWAGLYRPKRDQRFYLEMAGITKAVIVGSGLTIATLSMFNKVMFDGRDFSRIQYAIFAALLLVLLIGWRYVFRFTLRWFRARGWNLRHVGIIGTGRLAQVVCHTLQRNSWTGITPTFFISHHKTTARTECMGLPVFGGLDTLDAMLDKTKPTGVFVAMPGRMIAQLPELLSRLERHPLDVRIVPDMNPRFMPLNMAAGEMDGMPVLTVRQSPMGGWGRVTKRALDIIGALLAMIAFAFPMLVIAGLIRVGSRGPVIFRQERMSLNGQRFKIFKFRTMRDMDAEQQALRDAGRGVDAWTVPGDPRVTPLGRFLRRTSLDELPQLFNVLLGEMSLVGPRPERPELIERFREDWRGYMLRQNVKAGMTGWAQVNGLRGNTSLRKRLQYDLFYIRNWSFTFDLRILWMTIFRGFAHPNAN